MIVDASQDDPAGETGPVIEPGLFRRVLGHFPTGVAVIAAIADDGQPAGMAVNSFASASLDPALVAFFPGKASTSWTRMRPAASFCVSVLGHEQDEICRAFAVSGGDKFANVSWRPAPSGAPIVEGSLAWIDCVPHSAAEVGDHYLVVGRVLDLGVHEPVLPLLFFQGGYGHFTPRSVAAGG